MRNRALNLFNNFYCCRFPYISCLILKFIVFFSNYLGRINKDLVGYQIIIKLRYQIYLVIITLCFIMQPILELISRNANQSLLRIHISQLNKIGRDVLYYPKDLTNPTYADQPYVNRKRQIVEISKSFRIDQYNPDITYHEHQHRLWGQIYSQISVYRHIMCQSYLKQIKILQKQFNFAKRIPQMSVLSQYIKSRTGFQIKPAPGIVSQRDFLNALAFKVFLASQFMRHPLTMHFAPEPDVFHQYVGHIPSFVNQDIANISHQLGLLSLGASQEDLKILGNTYLFTIEFGLCRQANQIRAYGAAISSCLVDLKKIYQKKFTYKIYEPEKDWKRPFSYDAEQSDFLLVQSFQEAIDKIKKLSDSMSSTYEGQFQEKNREVVLRPKGAAEADKMKVLSFD